MKKLGALPFDPAEFIENEAECAEYLSIAMETGDPAFITDALGVIARAKGMTQIAKQTGLSRESLYRSMATGGNPEFSTVIKVMSAMGLKLTAEVTGKKDKHKPKRQAKQPTESFAEETTPAVKKQEPEQAPTKRRVA